MTLLGQSQREAQYLRPYAPSGAKRRDDENLKQKLHHLRRNTVIYKLYVHSQSWEKSFYKRCPIKRAFIDITVCCEQKEMFFPSPWPKVDALNTVLISLISSFARLLSKSETYITTISSTKCSKISK